MLLKAPQRPARPIPGQAWQQKAVALIDACERELWSAGGREVLDYLRHERKLGDETIRSARLGYCARDTREQRESWGVQGDGGPVWIPQGILVPWMRNGVVERLQVRRDEIADKENRYVALPGCANNLYMAGDHRDAVLVEGVLDALSIMQDAGDSFTAIATGSVQWCKTDESVSLMRQFRHVLIAFDADKPGEDASKWWADAIGATATRKRPLLHDANDMARVPGMIHRWLRGNDVSENRQHVLRGVLGLAPDQREWFEERAAIVEHEAGISRDEAAALAWSLVRAGHHLSP